MTRVGTHVSESFRQPPKASILRTMQIRIILSALVAFVVASLPVAATAQQQPVQQRPQMVQRFDHQTVRSLLDGVEVAWRIDQDANGDLTYRATAQSGVSFVAAPRSCTTEQGCIGLVLVSVFDGVNVTDLARFDAFVHQFNDRFPTAKVVRNGPQTVTLQAYINAAYGISYQNAQAQMLTFGQDITNLSRALTAFENAQ